MWEWNSQNDFKVDIKNQDSRFEDGMQTDQGETNNHYHPEDPVDWTFQINNFGSEKVIHFGNRVCT